MNRITNKQKRNSTGEWGKHPRPFLKRLGNSRLRLAPLDELLVKHIKKRVLRKSMIANRCLFCLDHIPKQWAGSAFKHHGSCKK